VVDENARCGFRMIATVLAMAAAHLLAVLTVAPAGDDEPLLALVGGSVTRSW
jgi:hypothetical protein